MTDISRPSEPTPASTPAEPAVVPASPAAGTEAKEKPALDPTRYGDWEKNGRCIDF